MSLSEWVLAQAFPPRRAEFDRLVSELEFEDRRSFALAALHDFLAGLDADELPRVLDEPPVARPPAPYDAVLAAMIEHAASRASARVPVWVRDTPAVPTPWFASALRSVRLHLLASSPPAFRRRNLFVDTAVGGRV